MKICKNPGLLFPVAAALQVSIFLSGCFVRLPMHGSPGQRTHVGTSVRTRMDIAVYTMADGKIAIDPKRADRDVGPAQHLVKTLPQGTTVTIKGLVYRRCPWGMLEYYVCRAPAERISFDVDNWESEKFLGWPTEPKQHPGR